MQPTSDNKTFLPFYEGSFIVELKPNIKRDSYPSGVVMLEEQKISIENGTAQSVMHGLQFYVGDQPFAFNAKDVLYVRKPDGEILWRNLDTLQSEI